MDENQDTRMPLTSLDVTDERIQALCELFPEAFTEGKVDFEKLKQSLGEFADDSPERYGLSWAGKAQAKRAFQSLSSGTLVPMRDESVNFDTTENLIIEGDNLEVLKLLQNGYFGQVKMIYIDPPYNTGHEFIYPDDYREGLDGYLRYSGQISDEGERIETERDTTGRFHSRWLSMMYPRLFLARNLLSDDGVLFSTIDDTEVHNLRYLLDDVFGPENFIANIVWQKKQSPQNDATYLSDMHDHVLLYAKRAKTTKDDPCGWQRNLFARGEAQEQRYDNPDGDPQGAWTSVDYTCNKNAEERPNLYYPIVNPFTGKEVWPPRQRVWRFERRTHERNVAEGRLWWGSRGEGFPRLKRYRTEVPDGIVPSTWWTRADAGDNQMARREIRKLFADAEDPFDTPKPTRLVQRMMELATAGSEHHIVLDFFAGSGTTADALLQQNKEDKGNRRFILVQLPEPAKGTGFSSIADICRDRVRRVIKKLEEEGNGKLDLAEGDRQDKGFRALRLTSSNFKLWKPDEAPTEAEGLAEQLRLYADHVLPGRSQEDILFELLLKAGVPLGAKITPVDVAGAKAFDVSDGLLLICLEDEVTQEILRAMTERRPQQILCLDSAFKGNDQLKTNTLLEMQSHDIKFHTV